MPTSEKMRRIADGEKRVHAAARKLARLRDPEKKLALLWGLAWGPLRDLEDFRPAGGWAKRR